MLTGQRKKKEKKKEKKKKKTNGSIYRVAAQLKRHTDKLTCLYKN